MTLDVNIKLENTVNRPAIPETRERKNFKQSENDCFDCKNGFFGK